MNIYLDTSALLRIVLGEPDALNQELRSADTLVASEMLAVESRRTIDWLRQQGALTTETAVARLDVVSDWLETVDLVLLRTPVFARASEPMPSPPGTLDALHLATALVWRERMNTPLVMATHDAALGLAARSFGFSVLGL